MARNVHIGLIQASTPFDPTWSVEKIKSAGLEKHLPLIEEAGKRGVQILGLQEIFNGPYFCPSQDAKWYDAAEAVPGPTTEAMQKIAKPITQRFCPAPSPGPVICPSALKVG